MKRFLFASVLLLWSYSGYSQDEKELKSQIRHCLDEIKDFVAIPNDALDLNNINRNITWLNKKFSERGFSTMTIKTENAPLFFATLPVRENLPTILFYMHFDGQAVDPAKWEQSNPYQVVLKEKKDSKWTGIDWSKLDADINNEWHIFGRSVSDDKGPIVMFLNAIDLLKKENVNIPFNVKVILDSEEEKGSKPLPKVVKQYKELLSADMLIINDGPLHASGKPTIVYGCRGITSLTLTTYGAANAQHSGHYGNFLPNPAFRLAHLLSSMKNVDGKVQIEGYYDGITIDETTRQMLAAVPDDQASILNTLQISSPEHVGNNYQESLQYPSLNVRGISSGWTGTQTRTIIPEKATAEIDIRLVPESDGDRLKSLVKGHIQQQGYTLLDHEPTKEERLKYSAIIKIDESPVTPAFRTSMEDPYGKWLEAVLTTTGVEKVVKIRTMGGTVPIAPFVNELGIPAFIIPLVNPDNNQHSPNENLRIGNIGYGINTFKTILSSSMDITEQ